MAPSDKILQKIVYYCVYVRVYNEHPDTLLDGAADVADSFLEYMGSEFFEISNSGAPLLEISKVGLQIFEISKSL